MEVTADKVLTYEEISRWVRLPTGIVLTAGCFDCLHAGHVEHLEYCRKRGRTLVVCVGSDATVRDLKGAGRPIVPAVQRARMVAALECVTAAVVSEEEGRMNFVRLAEMLRPSVLVVTSDDPAKHAKLELCKRLGITLMLDDTRPAAGPSTTGIVRQILEGVR